MKKYKEKRHNLFRLIKRLKKGDKEARIMLQDLLRRDDYRVVFHETFGVPHDEIAEQLKGTLGRKFKLTSSKPLQGGAPGLGKKA